jgi:hypothetical protein
VERSAFEVLGVEEGVSYAEARSTYLRRVRLLHPDRVAGDTELAAEATRLTAELTTAWKIVKRTFEAGGSARAGPSASTSSPPRPQRRETRDRSNEAVGEIVDLVIHAIGQQARRYGTSLSADEVRMLSHPVTGPDAPPHRLARRLRHKVLPLLDAVIQLDLGSVGSPAQAPNGLHVPQLWWQRYRRLVGLGNESFVRYLLTDLLDPSAADWDV